MSESNISNLRKVLIIEDDHALRRLIAKNLKKRDYSTYEAATGKEAIELIEKDDSFVLLLDQRLNDMTGVEVIEFLAKKQIFVNFIVMTGQGNESLAVKMMKMGAADYLVKSTEFLEILPEVLERTFKNIENEQKLKNAEYEQEKLQKQLIQAQKLESIGRLAGGVAHDFNNMLSVIIGYTELTLQQLDKNCSLYNNLLEIEKASKRSAELTKQLLTFARKQVISVKIIDLNEIISSMYKMLRRLIGEDIKLSFKATEVPLYIEADPSQIDQILANLCVNSRDAISGKGEIFIETSKIRLDNVLIDSNTDKVTGDYILLTVSDNGCGMNKETLEHVFEPFFTTKNLNEGTGLGLATIYGAVKQNKGFINIYSEPGKGTCIKIYLPEYKKEFSKIEVKPKLLDKNHKKATILIVEDEETLLQMTVNMLKSKGYKTISANRVSEAIEKANNYIEDIDLLITDIIMPEMNGKELSQQIIEIYPNIKILFMSGYTADVIASHGILNKSTNFLQKPFSIHDLFDKINCILNT